VFFQVRLREYQHQVIQPPNGSTLKIHIALEVAAEPGMDDTMNETDLYWNKLMNIHTTYLGTSILYNTLLTYQFSQFIKYSRKIFILNNMLTFDASNLIDLELAEKFKTDVLLWLIPCKLILGEAWHGDGNEMSSSK